jgi:DNA end-binding protein Ku
VPPDTSADASARAFWSGTVTFGLVSVPVNLFPANRSASTSLRMLDADGTPLSRRYFCSKDGKELESDDIVRGYELDSGDIVVVTDEELEALEPQKSRDIDLRHFVPADQIDPLLFQRAYFLTPAGGSTKAYRLLATTMEKEKRAGIATFVMRGKEYLIAILAERGILRAETLRFADEVRVPDTVGLPEVPRVKSARVKRMEKAIRALAAEEIDASEMEDPYADRLLALVQEKLAAGDGVREVEAEEEAEDEGVIDLMEVLKRSMAASGSGGRREPRRAPASSDGRSELSRDELYERAKELDIPGRSRMTKDELARAIDRSA